jgi:hypothetical protein
LLVNPSARNNCASMVGKLVLYDESITGGGGELCEGVESASC